MPVANVNDGGDRPRKVQFSEIQKPYDLDLDLGSGHTAYGRASVIDLYLNTKFHRNREETFLDERTYGRTNECTYDGISDTL